jgi:hypothetical protein
MTEFALGDRVRVWATANTLVYAGMTGTIARVYRDAAGQAVACHVRLDTDPAEQGVLYANFLPQELEPE